MLSRSANSFLLVEIQDFFLLFVKPFKDLLPKKCHLNAEISKSAVYTHFPVFH